MEWQKKIRGFDTLSNDTAWLDKMNNAIDYIEHNLKNEISYNIVAKQAFCSAHHFQRIFSFLTNTSLSEYIRHRRLTLAAFDLKDKSQRVVDIALRYGYDSPEAFTRAFKLLHGVNPTAARDNGVILKIYPKLTFHISIKGDVEMNYKIEKRDAFEVFGIETLISTVNQKDFEEVPRFWAKSQSNGDIDRIRRAANVSKDAPVHAALYNCTDTEYNYLICHNAPKDEVDAEFTKLTIPSGLWAVFITDELSKTEAAIQAADLWKRIFTEWFINSGFELANAPEMEMHFKTNTDKYITEIWIPVIKL